MPIEQKNPWYVSSTGNGLSLTIHGLSVVGLAETIVLIAKLLGTDVDKDTVVGGIATIVAAYGVIVAAFGFVRKTAKRFYAFYMAWKTR